MGRSFSDCRCLDLPAGFDPCADREVAGIEVRKLLRTRAAAREAEMGQARAGLVEAEDELAALPPTPDPSAGADIAIDTDSEAAERKQIIASRMRVAERLSLLEAQTQAAIQRLQTAIDPSQNKCARQKLERTKHHKKLVRSIAKLSCR